MKDERKVKGGLARAQALSPERRSEIAREAALARHRGADPAAAQKRAARKKAERSMERLAESVERFGREMAGTGASTEELNAAIASVRELLTRQGLAAETSTPARSE